MNPDPRSWLRRGAVAAGALMMPALAPAYPIDGYEHTGIGRLEAARRIEAGEAQGRRQPAGALLPLEAVDIRLTGHADADLPEIDPGFSRQIVALLGEYADRYGISVLDMTDPDNLRYAEHQGDVTRNPGSVGKMMVALAIWQALADLYPDDTARRWQLLKETEIIADEFIITDSHTVRRWDRDAEKLIRRPLQIGDRGSMMEYMDWMLSASSNAAAATLMKQAVLLKHFGQEFPVDTATADAFLKDTPKTELRALLAKTMHEPITRNGLDIERLRQGSLFTRTGKARIPGTNSYGTSRELMKFVMRMEQGRIVDAFSSRELKRLLYITERRIRYASSPALRDAAVYFKSGSLYKCKPEPDFKCKKYHGNVRNYMNSVAIVETPAEKGGLHYAVTLMSNVLRRNSAVDHQTLATRIHRLLEKYHAPKAAELKEAQQAQEPQEAPTGQAQPDAEFGEPADASGV